METLKESKLLEAFNPHTYEEWKEAAVALLKGASFEKKLISPTYEGFDLQPIYRRQDIENLPHLGSVPGRGCQVRSAKTEGYLASPWLVSQELAYGTPKSFNHAALNDVERGQTELNIPLDLAAQTGMDPDSTCSGRVAACGLSLATLKDLETALSGIDFQKISLYFHSATASLPIAALLCALARKRQFPLSELKGCLAFDPLSTMVWNGLIPVSLERAYRDMSLLTQFAGEHMPGMQTIEVNSNIYHNGGGNSSDEIAFALATGVEYLREMKARGLDAAEVLPHMRFSMAVGGAFFLEVAKFRAARLLWIQVARAFTGNTDTTVPFHLHARTGIWNKTVHDPYVNMLRTTTEAFSAVMGGCDSLHVSPFDEIIRVPNEFSRRIARNTHFILSEECSLTRTVDPAGGSWYIEWLTDQIAQKAWASFQEIEKTGGMSESLAKGIPQKKVEIIRAKRTANLAMRRDLIVGTNIYPNANEKPLDSSLPDYHTIQKVRGEEISNLRTSEQTHAHETVLTCLKNILHAEKSSLVEACIDAAENGATLGEISRTLWSGDGGSPEISPIPIRRAAMPFEQLRKSVLAAKKPKILQANLGASRSYRMRADWTSAFFQVGGFDVLNENDYEDTKSVIASARESKAPVIVITSTDKRYEESVPELAAALKKLPHTPLIFLAGVPGENESSWRKAGVDDFVHIRTNCFEMLNQILKQLTSTFQSNSKNANP